MRGERSGERGSAMVVMLIVLVALGTIAGLTVISVQGGSSTTSAQRFSAMALYAAESGAAVAMSWLRDQHHPTDRFKALVSPANSAPQSPASIPGNGIPPGATGNLLSTDQQGWYEVTLLNNPSDPGFVDNATEDGVIILQVTGYGPNGAMKRLEWEVAEDGDRDGNGVADSANLVIRGWRDLF